jgi:hypothetical protein
MPPRIRQPAQLGLSPGAAVPPLREELAIAGGVLSQRQIKEEELKRVLAEIELLELEQQQRQLLEVQRSEQALQSPALGMPLAIPAAGLIGSQAAKHATRALPRLSPQILRSLGITAANPGGMMPRLERPGETGAVGGELAGSLSVAPLPPVIRNKLRPIAAGLGAAAGLATERLLRGEPVRMPDLWAEAMATGAFEVAETATRAITKSILTNLEGGRTIREGFAQEKMMELGQKTFRPEPQDVISKKFQDVANTRIIFDTTPTIDYLNNLPRSQRRALYGRLRRGVTGGVNFDETFGNRTVAMLEATTSKGPARLKGMEIGALQHLRSETARLARAATHGTPIKEQLYAFRDALDDSIELSLGIPGHRRGQPIEVAGPLKEAQRAWFVLKSSDAVEDLVDKHSRSIRGTSFEGGVVLGGGKQRFNAEAFINEIGRRRENQSRLVQRIHQGFAAIPGSEFRLTEEFNRVAKQFKVFEFGTPIGMGKRVVLKGFSRYMMSPIGQKLFARAITEGRGRISPNLFALILNVARRDRLGGPGIPHPMIERAGAVLLDTSKSIGEHLSDFVLPGPVAPPGQPPQQP